MKKIISKLKKIYSKYEEIIKYLIVGVMTTLVSLLTYYLCVFTFLNPENAFELQIANIIAWIVSVTFAYFTNRKFVFKSRSEKKLKEVGTFYISRLATLGIDMGLMYLLVTLCHFNDKIIKIIVQVIVIVLNYLLSKLIVFKKK